MNNHQAPRPDQNQGRDGFSLLDLLTPPTADQIRGNLTNEDLVMLAYSTYQTMVEVLNEIPVDDDIFDIPANDMRGLTENEILMHIEIETFQSVTDDTSETELCCICLENYLNGEQLGILDCMHKFHLDCIKRWLESKNSCPLCNQTGLAVPFIEVQEGEGEVEGAGEARNE